MSLLLKLLAPWLSVILFWCVFENAWLALLGYHLQIICWNYKQLGSAFVGFTCRGFLQFALPAVAVGPVVYFLLPHLIDGTLTGWLERYQLLGWSLFLMVPYFGLVNPCLEQIHWGPLRQKTPLAHVMFAGYHLLVLYSLLSVYWLIIAFVVLVTVSIFWRYITAKQGGLGVASCSHCLADLGIITAACALAYC